MNSSSSHKGFALAEVLIGVSILAIVFMAVSNLLFSSIRANQVTMTSFSAYQLAQEGLELMRATRDSHWRRNVAWNGNVDKDNDLNNDKQTVPGVIANFSQKACYTVSLAGDLKSIEVVYLPGTTDKQSVLNNPAVKDQIHLYVNTIGQDTILSNTNINSTGQPRFNRFVCVEPDSSVPPQPKMKVTSVVTWLERWNTESSPSIIELTTELTDWKGGVL